MRSATSTRPDAAEIDLAQVRAALRSTENRGDARATELRDPAVYATTSPNSAVLVFRLTRRVDGATLASLATIGLAIAQVEAVLRESGRNGPI